MKYLATKNIRSIQLEKISLSMLISCDMFLTKTSYLFQKIMNQILKLFTKRTCVKFIEIMDKRTWLWLLFIDDLTTIYIYEKWTLNPMREKRRGLQNFCVYIVINNKTPFSNVHAEVDLEVILSFLKWH